MPCFQNAPRAAAALKSQIPVLPRGIRGAQPQTHPPRGAAARRRLARAAVFFAVFAAGSAGCASAKKMAIKSFLERARDKKAESVEYEPPPSPYKRQSRPPLDALWQRGAAGASISYLSNCSVHDESLREIQKNVLSEIKGGRRLREKEAGQSLYSVFEFENSGQKTMLALFILKKGSCSYILNLIAPSRAAFKGEEPVFRRFIERFKPS